MTRSKKDKASRARCINYESGFPLLAGLAAQRLHGALAAVWSRLPLHGRVSAGTRLFSLFNAVLGFATITIHRVLKKKEISEIPIVICSYTRWRMMIVS